MSRVRRKNEEDPGLYVTNPMKPLWGGLVMFGYFAFATVAAVAGVNVFSSALQTLGVMSLVFLASIGFILATEDSITVRIWQERPIVLRGERFRRRSQIWLDERASVERERRGQEETLRLTDFRGSSVTIPLRSWPGEGLMLEEIANAAAAAGATGDVGDIVETSQPAWVRAAFPVLLYVGAIGWVSVLIVLQVFR